MKASKGGARAGESPVVAMRRSGKRPGEPGAIAGVDERDGESPYSLVDPAVRIDAPPHGPCTVVAIVDAAELDL